MGKEESSGPVELKDDGSEKEEIDGNTNTEVGYEKVLQYYLLSKPLQDLSTRGILLHVTLGFFIIRME